MAQEGISSETGDTSGKRDDRIIEEYLSELKTIRSSGAGVAETSYYPTLSNLFNAVGQTLKPKVRAVINLNNQGGGIPDGGLFTADQFQRQADGEPRAGQLPARGAIEVKGTTPDIKAIAFSTQVKNYLGTYGIVIATNLRDFMIVTLGPNGTPAPMEAFSFADNEQDFWGRVAAHPRGSAKLRGDQFIEFIRRACLHNAPLNNPKDVAWFLASYARDALFRVEQHKQLHALQTVRTALEDALGMKFTSDKGEHFFRSTLVQTVFYGVFSAWVRWHKDNPGSGANFDWRTAEWSLHVPFIRTLYEEVAAPSRLEPLGLVQVLEWTAGVLNRVDRVQFFNRFEDENAVQYFYEPFLQAYDPQLRKDLGVWYTPREVVKYQVSRVDKVLREELALPDGLADANVVVLDPCCGTGAYLLEVLHSIAATLRNKGGDALVASDLKQAAMSRVFGFEIMPAPFVVAHLQLGLMLQTAGAPLSRERSERVGVYLTNALTGWEPATGPQQQVMSWVELQEERDAAEHVKRDSKILVVLGNPPYDGFAEVAIDEERSLTTAYSTTKNAPAPEGQGLNNPYVRFFRMAERRIAEMTGKGVVCFISNYSWLDGRSHPGMRERFLETFDRIWIDCLNGDRRATGKRTPEGEPDPSVFSTLANRVGIQNGTAIATLVRTTAEAKIAKVEFRHFWGRKKLADLLAASNETEQVGYREITPLAAAGFPFVPTTANDRYFNWPRLSDLLPVSYPGIKTSRDDLVVDTDREALNKRMLEYFDPRVTHAHMEQICPSATKNSARFDAKKIRDYLQTRGFISDGIRRYCYRPFDLRWVYWEPETKLLDEKRTDYVSQMAPGNLWLCAVQQNRKKFDPPVVSSILCSLHVIERGANLFPLILRDSKKDTRLFESEKHDRMVPNLSTRCSKYLVGLGKSISAESAYIVFVHIIGILYSVAYRDDNAPQLRQDWPRVPLPNSLVLLQASGLLGKEIAALLDTEIEAVGVTGGKIAPIFRSIGLISKTGGGQLNVAGGDLIVKAGWGHDGKEGATMPGKGKIIQRTYDTEEFNAIKADAATRGMTALQVMRLMGEKTCDVYLNGVAYWRNIPLNVWEFHIGGYQVIKKWLSYREDKILNRALKPEEVREVMNIARRIAAIILLQPKLDENYQKVKAAAFDWSREEKTE